MAISEQLQARISRMTSGAVPSAPSMTTESTRRMSVMPNDADDDRDWETT